MNESPEAIATPQEINPEQYLDSIGPDNKHNVSLLRDSFATSMAELGIGGFMLAVGGTVTKPNPATRKDVDIRVGVKVDNSDITTLPLLERYQTQFERWKNIVEKAFASVAQQEEFEIEVDPPHSDHDHEWMAGNDGMIRFTPKKGGVPIEMLCHQAGSLFKPPFVKLFSNIDITTA